MTLPPWLVSRALALGLVAILVVAPLWLLLGPALGGWQQQRADAATARDLLAAYRRQAAQRPALEARLRTLDAAGQHLPGLILAASPPAAAAELQAALRKLIEQAGGELRSAQPGVSTREAGFERLEVGFDLTLPEDRLPALLAALEAHDPYLFADRIDVTPTGKRLSLRLQIHAYRRAA